MLKNKFGMTKVLVLVLSVLMLVSLAACNKKDTIDPDAMNSAIQSAIDAANAAQAEKDAALASSIAADKAAQAERDAAIASSIAADKAAQEAELKKAQEAAAAASKQAAEASKQAAEASKQAAEASKEASKANTTVKTTKGDNTTAPIVIEDKTDALEAYSKLKTEYTVNKRNYYLTADYAELVLLFDKASVDLNNAQTLDAAKAVLETLKVDVAAIANAETAANEVQALIAALGDVETAVFTTAYEKVVEANEAFYQLLVDYEDYFDVEYDKNDAVESWNAKKVKDLGVIVSDLEKAEVKIDALEGFIAASLKDTMKQLYVKYEYDFDEDGKDLADEGVADLIATGYYKYLVLSVVNGGDVAAADLAVDWEYKVDEETGKTLKWEAGMAQDHPWGTTYAAGDKVVDPEAPTAFFTTEEFIDIFATPYLNNAFETVKTNAVAALKTATVDNGLRNAIAGNGIATNVVEYVVATDFNDYEDAMEAIFEAFEEKIEVLTFVGDYKGNATLTDAEADVWAQYFDAYVEAAAAIVNTSKTYATELYMESYEANIEALEDTYDERGESYEATYLSKLANYESQKEAFLANIEAAPVYTVEEIFSAELMDEYEFEVEEDDYFTATEVNDKLIAYVKDLFAASINDNFKAVISSQSGILGEFVYYLTEDLLALRDRVDPTNLKVYYDEDGETIIGYDADLYQASAKGLSVYVDDASDYLGNKYYANTSKFESLVSDIDATILALEAINEADYADVERTLKIPDSNTYKENKKKAIYWQNEAAKAAALEKYDTQAKLEDALIAELKKAGAGKWKNTANYWTINNTGLPVTYTYTAAEQACMAAETLYNDLYTKMHALMLEVNEYVGDYQDLIVDDNYEAIVKNVSASAELKAEVEALAETYKGYISTYTALKYSYSTVPGTTGFQDIFSYSDYAVEGGNHITNNQKKAINNSSKYILGAVVDDAAEYVDLFRQIFYTDGVEVYEEDYSKTPDSNVIKLWNYKKAAIAEITAVMGGFKNTYTSTTTNDNNVLKTTWAQNAANKNGYVYDETLTTGYSASSATGAAYEAELDALLASYVAKIQAVTLNPASVAEVKNVLGTVILTKFGDKTIDIDGDGNVIQYVNAEGGYNADLAVTAPTHYYDSVSKSYKTHASLTAADVYVKITDKTGNKDAEATYVALNNLSGKLYTKKAAAELVSDKITANNLSAKAGSTAALGDYVATSIDVEGIVTGWTEVKVGNVYFKASDGSYKAINSYVEFTAADLFIYKDGAYVAVPAGTKTDVQRYAKIGDIYVALTIDKTTGFSGTKAYGSYKTQNEPNEAFEVVAFTLNAAKQLVNAYAADLLGYDELENLEFVDDVVVSAWGTTDYTVKDQYDNTEFGGKYENADSRVFTAYKAIILADYAAIDIK